LACENVCEEEEEDDDDDDDDDDEEEKGMAAHYLRFNILALTVSWNGVRVITQTDDASCI